MPREVETIEKVVDAFRDEYQDDVHNVDDAALARITLHWRDKSGYEQSKIVMFTWRGDTEYIAGQLCKRLREKALITEGNDDYIHIRRNMSVDVYVTSVEKNTSNKK